MKFKTLCVSLASAAAVAAISAAVSGCMRAGAENVATSPDGNLKLTVGVDNGQVFYTVHHADKVVLDTSYLAMDMKQFSIGRNSKLKSTRHNSHDETWQPVWGEESSIRNNYNEITADFTENDSTGINFSVVFRVFDDGVGFRYVIPGQD